MTVLLTNLTLATRTGTEIVTRDLALGLIQAGHTVCVFSPRHGALAAELIESGVCVVDQLADVPFRPDIIHGHHHVETTLALLHFRNVPAIFVCHDRLSWHDSPPRLDAIRRYVAVDSNCLERLVLEAGIPPERTLVIPNAVDLRRFRQRAPLPARPSRALIFSNYATPGDGIETIRHACRESGLELDIVGQGVAAQANRPEDILGEYDLVFAKGRCALEAMACGCAVVLYDAQGLGPSVTSGQVDELRRWNFGKRCLQQPSTEYALRREIARYDPADAALVTKRLRAEASLDAAVARYVSLYTEVLEENTDHCTSIGNALEALARNVGSLEAQVRSSGMPLAMPPLPPLAASHIALRSPDVLRRMPAGGVAQVAVEIDNRSAELLASSGPYAIHLSYHWLAAGTRRCHILNGERTAFVVPVRPRSRHAQQMRVAAPPEAGDYVLVLTMVQEQQFWFDDLAQPVAIEWPVTVDAAECQQREDLTLGEVTAWTGARLDRDGEFANLGFVSDPMERMLTFVESPRFVSSAITCPQIVCVLTTPDSAALFPERMAVAVAADPRRCFFEIHNRLMAETSFYGKDFESIIHPGAHLHPRSWVDEKNVIIEAGVTVGPNATILGRARLGAGAVIQAGAVIGSAGFQTSQRSADGIELAHAGATEIGPGCHIFANAVIARGVFRQSTRLGRGCRIGNAAFVSHNCVLGEGVFVGHGAVVNGNVKIAPNAWIGPGATLSNNIEIGETAQISLGAAVIRDVPAGQRVTGSLATEHRQALRLMATAGKNAG